jgi:hypothetical protein
MPALPLHLPFTRLQYFDAGGTYDELRGLLRAGALRRVVRGVFVSAQVPDTLDLRIRVASLILPTKGVLARTGAAWMYGVDTRPPNRRHDPLLLEVAVPEGVQPIRFPGIRCFVEHLTNADVCGVRGVPSTTPLRTAVDLARWLPRGDALAAVDALAHRNLVDVDEYSAALERWKGYAFIGQAREIASLVDRRSESWGESITRLRIHDAGFELPDLQVPVRVDGVEYRLDFGWRRIRKGLEYDGERWHSSAEQRTRDEARRARIRDADGWEIRVVTKEHVLGRGRHFEQVVCELTGLVPHRLVA